MGSDRRRSRRVFLDVPIDKGAQLVASCRRRVEQVSVEQRGWQVGHWSAVLPLTAVCNPVRRPSHLQRWPR